LAKTFPNATRKTLWLSRSGRKPPGQLHKTGCAMGTRRRRSCFKKRTTGRGAKAQAQPQRRRASANRRDLARNTLLPKNACLSAERGKAVKGFPTLRTRLNQKKKGRVRREVKRREMGRCLGKRCGRFQRNLLSSAKPRAGGPNTAARPQRRGEISKASKEKKCTTEPHEKINYQCCTHQPEMRVNPHLFSRRGSRPKSCAAQDRNIGEKEESGQPTAAGGGFAPKRRKTSSALSYSELWEDRHHRRQLGQTKRIALELQRLTDFTSLTNLRPRHLTQVI